MPESPTSPTAWSCAVALRRVAGGDRVAWCGLVEVLGEAVYRVTLRILREPSLADDACQETFLLVGRCAAQFDGHDDATARAWIMRIACRSALQLARSRRARHRRTSPIEAASMAEAPGGPRGSEDTEDTEDTDAGAKRLDQELRSLPSGQREILCLHFVVGLEYERIASGLGITVTHARVRVHRALKALRKRLERHASAAPALVLLQTPTPPVTAPADLAAHCLARWPAGAPLPSPIRGFGSMAHIMIGGATLSVALLTCVVMLRATGVETAPADAPRPTPTVRAAPDVQIRASPHDPVVPETFRALMGSWRSSLGADAYVRFAPGKSWIITGTRVTGAPMAYRRPGICFLPNLDETEYHIADGVLTVMDESKPITFVRIVGDPPGFTLDPLVIPAPTTLADNQRQDAERELAALFRRVDGPATDVGDGNGKDDPYDRFETLIAHVGWIDAVRFSPEDARMACLIARRSGRPALTIAAAAAALPDAVAGHLDGQACAELVDTADAERAEPQTYGTSIRYDDAAGHILLWDRAHVDDRRATLRLDRLASHLHPQDSGKMVLIENWP